MIEPTDGQIALIGDSLSLSCNAESNMNNCTSCITWSHNNTNLTVNNSISDNKLTLNNIEYSHNGNYCCTANGSIISCVSLTVTGMILVCL